MQVNKKKYPTFKDWILNSPQALGLLYNIAIHAALLLNIFFFTMFFNSGNWLGTLMFGFLIVINTKRVINIHKYGGITKYLPSLNAKYIMSRVFKK